MTRGDSRENNADGFCKASACHISQEFCVVTKIK